VTSGHPFARDREPVKPKLLIPALAALFVAGALLASVALADTTTTTSTTVVTETSTQTQTEVAPVTTTVEQTTTQRIIVPAPTTTDEATAEGEGNGWIWVLLGIAGVALVLVICLAVSRGHESTGVSPAERRRRLDGTVATWGGQGWALMSQTGDSAVLQRGGEQLLITVDEVGHVSTRPLQSSP
jgi:hypothetical protein